MARIKSKKFTGVYLNHLANGDISYSFTYKDANNKLKRFTVGKKSNSITETYTNTKRNEFINKIRLGDDPIAHKKKKNIITLDALADVYFNDKEGENKANKKQHQRYDLHIKNVLGAKDINSITKDDIKVFRKKLIDQKKAPKTINGIITLLTAIVNYSIKEKDLKIVNPTTGIKRLKTDDNRERFLNIDEVRLLIESIKDNAVLYQFVKMALSTGARLEGVLHIQKKDINLTHNTVTLKDLKSDKTYTGFFDDELKQEISSGLSNLKANDYYIGGKSIPFPSRTIQRQLKPILDRLFNTGLDTKDAKNRVVIHSLRHTFASLLAINGVPIFTIQKLMGHADLAMTARYAKLSSNTGRSAVQGLYHGTV